jgi:CheY-like chemotaxis protein
MPIMDGLVASSKIREYEKENNLMPSYIMAVTGVASPGFQQEASAVGIDKYLIKPTSLHELKLLMNIA